MDSVWFPFTFCVMLDHSATTGDVFEELQELQNTFKGYNSVFVRINGRADGRVDGQAESGNKFYFMTKLLPFKPELEWYQMVVFKNLKENNGEIKTFFFALTSNVPA